MKLSEVFTSDFLKAEEIEQDTVVTIAGVEVKELGSGKDKDRKPVITFEELDKGLACNRTNAGTIGKLYGDDTDDWIGKQITLFATEVDFRGEQVLAIRVRTRAPKQAAPAKSTSNDAPASEPENPVAAGRARAWKAFIAATPSSDDADRKNKWLDALKYSFPLKNQKDFTADDWKTFTLEVQTGYDDANGGFIPV